MAHTHAHEQEGDKTRARAKQHWHSEHMHAAQNDTTGQRMTKNRRSELGFAAKADLGHVLVVHLLHAAVLHRHVPQPTMSVITGRRSPVPVHCHPLLPSANFPFCLVAVLFA